MRDEVKASRPAWYPTGTQPETKGLTPGQVQRSALEYLVQLVHQPAIPEALEKEKVAQKATILLPDNAFQW